MSQHLSKYQSNTPSPTWHTGTDPGWLLTCDGLSLAVTMTPDTGHSGAWVSQHSHNITSPPGENCSVMLRSGDRSYLAPPLQIIFCTITRSVPRLIWFSSRSFTDIGLLILGLWATYCIISHITYHTFQYFTLHHWRTSWKTRMRLINVILINVPMSPRWLGLSSTRRHFHNHFDERMSLLWQFPTTRAVLQSQ